MICQVLGQLDSRMRLLEQDTLPRYECQRDGLAQSFALPTSDLLKDMHQLRSSPGSQARFGGHGSRDFEQETDVRLACPFS